MRERSAGQIAVTIIHERGARAGAKGIVLRVDSVWVSEGDYINTVGAGDAFLGGFLLAAAGGCINAIQSNLQQATLREEPQ
jgi:sugar/nucleoside kinase (ribokinase family)